jgi:membrane-bound lytic murein transglycosylase B
MIQAAVKDMKPFDALQKRLVDAGFDQEDLIALYKRPEVTLDHRGISAYFLHRESTLNYDQFLSKSSIKNAKRYQKKHKKALQQAATRHGVPEEIITAILLVESRFGTYKGKRYIFNTLSNLAAIGDPSTRDMIWDRYVREKAGGSKKAFDKWSARKSAWAFKELQAYLRYVKMEGVDPFSMRGSLAGALGYAQFVPTSVLKYVKDGNDDGKINLYEHRDAIESIANYLKRHGWKPGQNRDASFNIILRYNNSKYYANTILKVADRIAAQ